MEQETTAYVLKRSERRTLGIYILPGGGVEVRAPKRLSLWEIEAFLARKSGWIEEKRRLALPARPGLIQDGTALFRGQSCPVREGAGSGATFDGTVFTLPAVWLEEGETARAACREGMMALYTALIRPEVERSAALWAERLGVAPSAVGMSRACGRWGSCSSKGSLRFSWMLAAVEPAAMDYVVVHELCHLREHNHSPRFWALVAGALPDYRARQEKLRPVALRLASSRL